MLHHLNVIHSAHCSNTWCLSSKHLNIIAKVSVVTIILLMLSIRHEDTLGDGTDVRAVASQQLYKKKKINTNYKVLWDFHVFRHRIMEFTLEYHINNTHNIIEFQHSMILTSNILTVTWYHHRIFLYIVA